MLRVRQPSDAALTEALLRFSRLEPTYPELGASLGESLPPGYHHGRSSIALGRGDEVWTAACAALDQWQAHRGAGVRVFPADAPEAGATVALCVRIGPVVDVFGCRIVQVVDEADRYGFAYGTLPGHPERGEESFVLERTEPGVGDVHRHGVRPGSATVDAARAAAHQCRVAPVHRPLPSLAAACLL